MTSKYDKDKRRKRLKDESAVAWRDKIDFTKTLNQITKAESAVASIAEETKEIAAYRLLLDSQWKRMNKLLPDLKAIEGQLEHSVKQYVITESHRGKD